MYDIIEGFEIKPLSNDVLVFNMEKGYRRNKKTGILFLDDSDFKEYNIKPRWCQVYKVGNKIDFLKEGDWILVEHGRWTTGVRFNDKKYGEIYLQKVDINGILLVSEYNFFNEEERLKSLLEMP